MRYGKNMKKKPDDIKQIEDRIAQLQKKEQAIRTHKAESEYAYATKTGFRVGTELLSGVLVGAGLGYVADWYFATQPWCLVFFLFLGFAAGFLNVYRFVKSEENKKE